jgi:cytochrome c biogenesis protein CcdA
MATNLAAVSYLARRAGGPWRVLAAGLMFALGQAIAYVALAVLLLGGMASAGRVSTFLQANVGRLLGPTFVLAAMVFLELLSFRVPRPAAGSAWPRRLAALGLAGALPLGMLLALAFCPVSAACFFVSLLAILTASHSRILLPSLYALGAALPVVVFAVLLAAGVGWLGKATDRAQQVQRRFRLIAGVVLLAIGIHYSLKFNFEVTPFWDPWLGGLQSLWMRWIAPLR